MKNVGDYVTLDLLRDSILVVRGKDNELRAFMNVCRHRGAKLLDGSGHCKARMTPRFHKPTCWRFKKKCAMPRWIGR